MQSNDWNVDEAKQFFKESGILGPKSIQNANDLIRKTSSIHNDKCLQNKIRKRSWCFRSKAFGDNYSLSAYDTLLNNLQNEIYNVKEVLATGEAKIITLRAEINNIKGDLAKIMYAQIETYSRNTDLLPKNNKPMQNFCAFCETKQ